MCVCTIVRAQQVSDGGQVLKVQGSNRRHNMNLCSKNGPKSEIWKAGQIRSSLGGGYCQNWQPSPGVLAISGLMLSNWNWHVTRPESLDWVLGHFLCPPEITLAERLILSLQLKCGSNDAVGKVPESGRGHSSLNLFPGTLQKWSVNLYDHFDVKTASSTCSRFTNIYYLPHEVIAYRVTLATYRFPCQIQIAGLKL